MVHSLRAAGPDGLRAAECSPSAGHLAGIDAATLGASRRLSSTDRTRLQLKALPGFTCLVSVTRQKYLCCLYLMDVEVGVVFLLFNKS